MFADRKYTLEKMFANQLIESAKDELSFRTVIRDLTTKSPMLQIVLLNPNSWYCTGSCLDAECGEKSALKLDLHPIIKLLFSDCSNNKGSQLRLVIIQPGLLFAYYSFLVAEEISLMLSLLI